MTRDERQHAAYNFGLRAFGEAHMLNKQQRALRLLEEAIELYQAVGAPQEMAHRLVDFVFSRPPGDPRQELGGVCVTTLIMAEALDVSADEAEKAEVKRLFDKGPEFFAQRNRAKVDAGFDLVKP